MIWEIPPEKNVERLEQGICFIDEMLGRNPGEEMTLKKVSTEG